MTYYWKVHNCPHRLHANRIASVGPLKPVFPPFRRKCPVPAASGQHLVANRDRGLIVVQVVPVGHFCRNVGRAEVVIGIRLVLEGGDADVGTTVGPTSDLCLDLSDDVALPLSGEQVATILGVVAVLTGERVVRKVRAS